MLGKGPFSTINAISHDPFFPSPTKIKQQEHCKDRGANEAHFGDAVCQVLRNRNWHLVLWSGQSQWKGWSVEAARSKLHFSRRLTKTNEAIRPQARLDGEHLHLQSARDARQVEKLLLNRAAQVRQPLHLL